MPNLISLPTIFLKLVTLCFPVQEPTHIPQCPPSRWAAKSMPQNGLHHTRIILLIRIGAALWCVPPWPAIGLWRRGVHSFFGQMLML